MQLNIPSRLLRVVVGCGLIAVLLISTQLLIIRQTIPKPLASSPSLENVTANTAIPPLEQDPYWTTEQLKPRFAYAQYATNRDYLCNAIINFVQLSRYGAKYDQVLIHPTEWSKGNSEEAKALANIRKTYPQLNLRPFDVISTNKGDSTWRDSLTKFHAFALTEWTRVLAFDSDALVLNSMDHYFLSPLSPIAVPRAYWLNEADTEIAKQVLGSHVMLLEPDEKRYHKIINEALSSGDFDMEVINHMFRDSAMILPHRRLALLTGEFRATNHSKYLAPDVDVEWNAMGEVSRAVLVHFSDWPLPKPWKKHSQKQWETVMPACPDDDVETEDKPRCADRLMWTGFYEDYNMYKDKYREII
ncbi:nucleotide-diphospho-sugar transferase [Thelonectria olida]|uniref:Nucleotide-diphospho-sugar transferase n=1 Tax=Thelonectria olida TaxID=1576542 RepID=A0A9P9AGE0_9HYPO|nr:nucleotide-diphospho-sugar transferase [Thelonectria olida]